MKKVFAAILAASMMLALVACGGGSSSSSAGTSSSGAASSSTSSSGAASSSTKVDLTGMQRILFMNNAFAGLETSKQCYNAKEWHKAYKMSEIMDANFWFTPAADTTVKLVATDGYATEYTLDVFKEKYISFDKDNVEYDYDLFVGPAQKEKEDVWYKAYAIVDNEAILMMKADGWKVSDLFEKIGMVDAEEYTFISGADGFKYHFAKEDLTDEVTINYDANGVVGVYLPEYKSNLTHLRYIIPKGVTEENADQNATGVQKVTVALNAEGVLNTEAPYLQNRAGTWYEGAYSLNDLFTKYNVVKCNKIKVVASDGYSQREEYEDVIAKYIAYQAPVDGGSAMEWFTLGQTQQRDTGVFNIVYLIAEEEAFAHIPAAGLKVADAFAEIEMVETANYLLTYADGKTETKTAADVKGMTLAADSTLLSITAVG